MGRTLIVDDMEKVYNKISGYFKNPTHARTVEKALEEINSGNYKLVISDCYLSKDSPRGGLEIIEATKDKEIISLLMSKENHRKEAEDLGAMFMFKKELFKLLEGYDGRKQS